MDKSYKKVKYYKSEELALKMTDNGFYIKENGKERRQAGDDYYLTMMILTEGREIDEKEYNDM